VVVVRIVGIMAFYGAAAEHPAIIPDDYQRVVVQRARDTFAKLCAAGQMTEYLEIEGATHDGEYALAADPIEAWFADRLAAVTPTNSCPAVTP
jgi:putative copper export protein